MPVDKAADWRRNTARLRHLDELARKVRALEQKLDEITAAGSGREKGETK
jgi:UDP-3-O-[3-hydroxymyristoyl] glucosamine N-acyltransferase